LNINELYRRPFALRYAGTMRTTLILFLCLALHARADSRQAYSADSPAWMAAIGKLDVPGQKWENADRHHLNEHCTATLVGNGGPQPGRYILTAWHCVEYYRDLSQAIIFTLPAAGIEREARLVASGGGMHADWALLRLLLPVAAESVLPFMALTAATENAQSGLTMAGYSSDNTLGLSGSVLTYDPDCTVITRESSAITTNCTAYKGASGGPVVGHFKNAPPRLLGVISAGDSRTRSLYAPSSLFASALRQYLPQRVVGK
jgi:hypothetical protein